MYTCMYSTDSCGQADALRYDMLCKALIHSLHNCTVQSIIMLLIIVLCNYYNIIVGKESVSSTIDTCMAFWAETSQAWHLERLALEASGF